MVCKVAGFTVLLCLLAGTFCYAQYNFESCYSFWKLTDKLKNGIEPSTDEWNNLRQSEGYKRKNISDARWTEFTAYVRMVFMPGNEATLHAHKNDLDLKWITRFAKEEDALKEYVTTLEQRHIMDSAIFYANQNLPKKYQNTFKAPVMYFLLFDYDGSATGQGVVMDLLVSYDMERFRPGIFSGHEVYHYALAYRRIKLSRFKNVAPQHHAVFMAVNGISEEGLADFIDKPQLLFNEKSPYLLRDTFQYIYKVQSPECIKKINEALERLSVNETKPFTDFSYWQALMPVSGHIPGTYMGQVILRNGLKQKAIESVSNPFQFFYLYNQAAQKDNAHPPVFSEKAIRFLKSMEKKYIK